MNYETLASPVDYGGIPLKNRIIFAPTTLGMRPQEALDVLGRIAAGGCAMLILGDVPVGRSHFAPTLFSKKGFSYYQQITRMAHEQGCLVCAQLHQSDTNMGGMVKYLPRLLTGKLDAMELRHLMNQETGRYISALPTEKVRQITASFGEAAVLAVQAGFDAVQVHGDRMCGSFSSSLFNRRTDEYGGSPENRARFALESIGAIREKLPELPIDYKLAIRQEHPHYGNAGVAEEELSVFVPLLEQAGVTSFHVALANHSRLEDVIPPADHPDFGQEGCFLKFCDEVRRYTALPLCGVGGLNDPDFIEAQLASGRIDCAAMSRQLIADPDWVNNLLTGDPSKIHRCIRCNQRCLGGMYQHKGVHCIYERTN